MVDQLSLLFEPPSIEGYVNLRRTSGLSPRTPAQARAAIPGTWAWCHVRDGAREVAMSRVIGDGSWYFVIADVATLPDYQRRGIGRWMLGALLDRIRAHAVDDAYVTLMADPPGVALYESFGFRKPDRSTGMTLTLDAGPRIHALSDYVHPQRITEDG